METKGKDQTRSSGGQVSGPNTNCRTGRERPGFPETSQKEISEITRRKV